MPALPRLKSAPIAMTDNHGYVLAPLPVAPVKRRTWSCCRKRLKAFKKIATQARLDLRGVSLNLDGGCDSTHNRKMLFNAGMRPNIKEYPRNRKTTKRGRKRLFNAAIHV